MAKKKELETTPYRFISEVRVFISDLFRKPTKADTSKYLKDRGFTRKKLIDELISRGIISRSEKILDSTNSDKKKPTYSVKYKRYSDNFNTKMNRLYSKYFEKNIPEKKKQDEINEEGGAGSCSFVGGSFEQPIGKEIISRPMYEGNKPTKKIRITERQLKRLQEATTTMNIGSSGNYTANGLILKTSDGNRDPAYDR